MPAKKKEAKPEEPVFLDESGHFVHAKEGARYDGGIRRYMTGAAAAQEAATAAQSNQGSSLAAGKSGRSSGGSRKEEKKAEEEANVDGNLAVYRHGRGTYTSPSLQYEGDWCEDVMEGEGTLRFLLTGSVYTGTFQRGRFEGYGTYTWADGSTYAGSWRMNRIHGEGVYTDAHGTVWKGQYFNGTGPGLDRVYHNAAATAAATPASEEG